MKKLFKCICLCMVIATMHVQGQFVDATTSETTLIANILPAHTGNDIRDDGTDIYRVAVCDNNSGGAPGLMWEVNYGGNAYSNADPFNYGDAYDPDVCLVKGTNRMYALAAYYLRNAGSFIVDVFEWDISNYLFALQYSLTITGDYKSAINIDANDNGQFIVVFDDSNDDFVHAIGGVAGTGPAFNYPTAWILNPLATTPCTMPDVALSFGSNSIAYITYVDYRGYVQVFSQTWANATNSNGDFTGTLVATITPPSTYEEIDPRIACPQQQWI